MEFGQHVFSLQMVHFIICVFCFALLVSLSAKELNNKKKPLSVLFMALSIVMWLAVELTRYLFDFVIDIPGNGKVHQKWLFVNIFSSFNNALILAALPIFKKVLSISKLQFLFKWKDWMVRVLALNIIVVLIYIVAWMFKNELGSTLVSIIDYIYSIIVISLFFYGAIHNFIAHKGFSKTSIRVIALFSIMVIVTEFLYKPIFGISQEYRFISLYVSHLFAMMIMIMTVLTAYFFRVQLELKSKKNEVERINQALELKLKERGQNNDSKADKHLVLAYGRHLSFFKRDKNLVVELTMLDKGILKSPIYCSSVNREYKDLLRFAVYMKAGKIIKAYGGAHSGFGDIYKSILDIRTRLLNKHLHELGLPLLKANELIVQRIKGSGIYELDCKVQNIEVDLESLLQVRELKPILSMLDESISI